MSEHTEQPIGTPADETGATSDTGVENLQAGEEFIGEEVFVNDESFEGERGERTGESREPGVEEVSEADIDSGIL